METKKCGKCKQVKSVSEFYRHAKKGRQCYCKECVKLDQRERRRSKEKALIKIPPLTKLCKTCGKELPLSDFPDDSRCKWGKGLNCIRCYNTLVEQREERRKEKEREYRRKWYSENKEYVREKGFEYRSRPEVKDRIKKRRQSPEFKEWEREYRKTEVVKAAQKRYKSSEKGKATQRKYRQSEKGKLVHAAQKISYRKNNPEKHAAHMKLQKAVGSGKIKRMPCEICGTTEDVHGHHEDYSKPLEVIWLCKKHHDWIHCVG